MSWNYRVFRRVYDDGRYTEASYGIYECHYDENGKPKGWTADEAQVGSESKSGLADVLTRMTQALEKPVLDYETGAEVPQSEIDEDESEN